MHCINVSHLEPRESNEYCGNNSTPFFIAEISDISNGNGIGKNFTNVNSERHEGTSNNYSMSMGVHIFVLLAFLMVRVPTLIWS
jgi:pseudouridine-5'-phosphate glycosidase